MKEKIAVIGGGPAGILAAGTAGSRDKDVTIFEKNNKIGKKLYITGKGRCNITNLCNIEDMINSVVVNHKFLYSGFYTFTNENIIELLKNYGVKIKVERGNRVFPSSDKSSDVIKALQRYLLDNNVKVLLNKKIRSIKKMNTNKFLLTTSDENKYEYDKVIIATGGKTYSATGSTGDGYFFAKSLGHKIIEPKPALVPCEIKEKWVKQIQGLSLKNVKIYVFLNNKKIFEDFGEMLFTHFGISGPIVLTMSSYINKYENSKINIILDLKPGLSKEKLENRIIKDFEKYTNKQFKNSLNDLLPKKLISTIIELSNINPEKEVNQITKEERNILVELIKGLKITFDKLRPIDEGIVTSGGVDTSEINSSTMESKIVDGLYFAGEVIDVDALTGGFNLQIAYSTGYLAGFNC